MTTPVFTALDSDAQIDPFYKLICVTKEVAKKLNTHADLIAISASNSQTVWRLFIIRSNKEESFKSQYPNISLYEVYRTPQDFIVVEPNALFFVTENHNLKVFRETTQGLLGDISEVILSHIEDRVSLVIYFDTNIKAQNALEKFRTINEYPFLVASLCMCWHDPSNFPHELPQATL